MKDSNLPSLYTWCLQIVARIDLVSTHGSRKTCLVLQCIRVFVCSKAFFINVSLFSKTIYWNPAKMSFQKTFDISYYYYYYHYCYYTFIHCWHKKFQIIKVSQKRGKIIYLHKGVSINFFITLKILSKFQDSSCGKIE